MIKYVFVWTFVIIAGCLSSETPSEHPCETADHCVYDSTAGESNCKDGYTWADPSDANNYNCVSVEDESCTPMSCDVQDAECGSIPDACGNILDCGTCPEDLTCGAGGPNQCGAGECIPITCSQVGAECGSISDGCGNILNCGTCASGFSCNENNYPPICVADDGPCEPETCQSLGLECGTANDGCGGTLDCGPCDTCGNGQIDNGEACDGSNLNNQSCTSLGFDTGTLTCNSDCTLNQSQCEDVSCPPNSSYAVVGGEGGCYCDEGYVVNEAGTGCEEEGNSNNGNGGDCSRPSYAFYFDDPSSTRYSMLETDPGEPGVVIDSVTGYMVQKCMVGKTGSWCHEGDLVQMDDAEADDYCADLTLAGYDDWELIPMEILATMIDDRGVTNDEGIFRSSSFPSSRVLPDDLGRTVSLLSGSVVPETFNYTVNPRWSVSLATGAVVYADRGAVRCARKTPEADLIQSTPRCITTHVETSCSDSFFDNNTYCLRNHFEDSLTGLEWKRYEDRYTFGQPFDDQEDHCEDLSYGTGNWRLATYAELFSLADYSRSQPPYLNFTDEITGGIYWMNRSSDPLSGYNEPRRKWKLVLSEMRVELREQSSTGSYGTAEAFCVREIP